MLIVGLTGGIATGKSTVSTLLQQKHHLPIIDADILARTTVEPGTRTFKQILSTFREDLALRDEQGTITGFDCVELGKRVFSGDEVAGLGFIPWIYNKIGTSHIHTLSLTHTTTATST